MGIRDGWQQLTGRIAATAKGLAAKLRPKPAAMIGLPPSARHVPADPALHALDFAQCYADPMDYLVSQRMLELGIEPKHIGSSDLTHGIRHAAFNLFKRTGDGNGPVGRLTVDSGVFNPNLHSDLGKIAWMRSSPRSIRSSSGPATPRPKRRQPIRSFPSAPGPEVFFVLSEGDHDDP
jgi:hypothetical protein